MRARVRRVRACRRRTLPPPAPSFPRIKNPRVPVLLLEDMNLCYRLLRQLVPGLPPGQAASRVEILQHAIDYILDLQTVLDSPARAESPENRTGVNGASGGRRASGAPVGTPSSARTGLVTMVTDAAGSPD